MPQWDFLDFLAEQADVSGFPLMMKTAVTDLIVEKARVVGVRAQTTRGLEIQADLVVAADGRAFDGAPAAGLAVTDIGAPMDVLWMRLSRPEAVRGNSWAHRSGGTLW